MSAKPTTKQFGKSTREVPASADKAKKWYPADDDSEPKKVSLFVVMQFAISIQQRSRPPGYRKSAFRKLGNDKRQNGNGRNSSWWSTWGTPEIGIGTRHGRL